MSDEVRVRSLEEAESHVRSLTTRVHELEQRLTPFDERQDTLDSPRWKRLLFRADGWGPWYRLRVQPKWRPWRRWYTS